MKSFGKFLIAGASALAVAIAAMPAQAEQAGAPRSVAGIDMKDIQTVGHGHGRGGGRSFSGGGFGGGRSFSGGGFRGGGYGGRSFARGGYYGGSRYGGYSRYGRGYGHRHRGYGGYYVGAGILGLAAGAALASPYYGSDGYYDDDYYGRRSSYYGSGYGYRRAAYRGAECQIITRRHDAYGRPIRVIRYRPC